MTEEDFKTILKSARQTSQKDLARIRRLSEDGERGLRNAIDRYLKSHDVALIALAELAPKFGYEDQYEALLQLSRRISLFEQSDELARLLYKEKPKGGFRVVFDFGFENKVRQRIVKNCLSAIYQPHPFAFGVKGRGLTSVKGVIQEAFDNGFRWAKAGDVRRCYPSINPDGAKECLPIPHRVTENVILSRGYHTHSNRIVRRITHMSGVSSPEEAQQGIATGSSASPLAVSYVLESLLLPFISDDVKIYVYADDFVILTKTRREAESTVTRIQDALETATVGPLRCITRPPRRIYDGFWFCGRHFQQLRKKGWSSKMIAVKLPSSKLNRYDTLLSDSLARAHELDDNDIIRLQNRIDGFVNAYPDIPALRHMWHWRATRQINEIARRSFEAHAQ